MTRTIARKYHFEGQVQGVGFRRTTESVACIYDVTGYVMNLADGRVEVHVEGPIEAIDKFVHKIDETFENKISRVTQELVDARKFETFSVNFESERPGI